MPWGQVDPSLSVQTSQVVLIEEYDLSTEHHMCHSCQNKMVRLKGDSREKHCILCGCDMDPLSLK
jgi:hypothetical protein